MDGNDADCGAAIAQEITGKIDGKEKPAVIYFYISNREYGWMSNFYAARQRVDGIEYPTNEHYYQCMKASNDKVRAWIASAPKPFQAMKAGRALRKSDMVDNWDEHKVTVMLEGLRAKFIQNQHLAALLLCTGDAQLCEDSPTDRFWGGKLPGSKNMLGKLLVQVRGELREQMNMKIREVIE